MTTATERLSLALADRYRLERELGAGGMATVYLAQDLKHDRKVALKVLRPELAAVLGAERFLVEIKTTASLQHPHILPLFDSGTADGFLFYVMPFIDGETLRDRLNRETQLGVDDAVRIAREVADALDYAHRRGVIHRDIKPENILLHDHRPMVADFGIALAVSAAAGGRMTETGLSLGTPHYMSPEQATAEKEITGRSDIYSIGSVLYEMLTGQPPHLGGSAQQVIMKIITEAAASVTQLRKSVPPNVAAAVAKALEKLPADRFATAQEFARALADPAFHTGEGTETVSGPMKVNAGWKWAAAALAFATVGAGGLAGWALSRTDSQARDVGLPPNAPMQMTGQFRNYAAALDGSFVVYEAQRGATTQLWYRSLNGTETYPVPGTEGVHGTPRISPDGKRVAFMATGNLKVVTLGGGPVATVAQAEDPQGGEWLRDGKLFFGDDDGRVLRWVDPATGPGREVEVNYCIHPQLIGAGDRVLCGGGSEKYATVLHLDRPLQKRPLRRSQPAVESASAFLLGSHFRIVGDSYLVYMSIDGTLMGTRIDNLDSLTVGRSVPLVPMVRRSAYSGVGFYDISDVGTLTYVPGINADVGRLIRLTRDGRLVQLPVDEAAYLRFTPSPDGRRLATVVEGIQQQELRVYDLGSGTQETYDKGFFIGAPAWSPNGSSLAYRKSEDPDVESLLLRRLDSPDKPRQLLSHEPPLAMQTSSYLADDFLLVGVGSKNGVAFIVDPTTTPAKVDSLGLSTFFVSTSPDRRWIAYQNLGVSGIQLQPWPTLDRRYLVDAEGGEPRWRSATELVYLVHARGETSTGSSSYRIRIDPSSSTPVGKRELIIRDPLFADTPGWSHAITTDGDLIYLQSPAENLGYYFRVIPGWVEQMKRAVDAANR